MSKQILNLKDLVQYQPGSVVSKEVLRKPTGTVTTFAFAKGEGLSELTAPFDAIVNVLDGQAKITISGEDFLLTAGQMIIMPANEPHALKAPQKFKMLLTMIRV